MNHFKTLQTTTLAIALLVSGTAHATGYSDSPCDLRLQPKVVGRENVKKAVTLNGRFNDTGRKFVIDALLGLVSVTVVGIPFTIYWFGGNGTNDKLYDDTHYDSDTATERSAAFEKLELACRKFIRENYKRDIIYDNGPNLVARNYFCSAPMVNSVENGVPADNNGDGNQYAINIMYGEAVFEPMTVEQITQKKCAALEACYRTADGKDLNWLTTQMGTLGCM